MHLVRFDPYRNLGLLHNRVNRLFNETFPHDPGEEPAQAWAPPVDIFEHGDDLVMRAELPGVMKEDLDVRVEGNVLTLRGERRRDQAISEESYHRIERSYGAFTRSFTLPGSVDANGIRATFKDGVLDLVLPKAEDARPRKIEVSAA